MKVLENLNIRKAILIIGFIFLICNTLFGLMLSIYPNINMIVNDIIIIATTLLLIQVNDMKLKDAFRMSLMAILSVTGILQWIIGIFSPARLEDNFGFIIILILLAIEAIILLIVKYVNNIAG